MINVLVAGLSLWVLAFNLMITSLLQTKAGTPLLSRAMARVGILGTVVGVVILGLSFLGILTGSLERTAIRTMGASVLAIGLTWLLRMRSQRVVTCGALTAFCVGSALVFTYAIVVYA
jgi:hypothetical protein